MKVGHLMRKHLSTRSIIGSLCSCLIIMTMCAAFLLNGSFSHAASASAAAASRTSQSSSYTVTKGTLTPVATVDPRALTLDTSPTSAPPRGPRPTHPQGKTGTIAAPVTGLDNQSKLLENFNGVSSLDSENTNFGAEFEPPDQGLCVGNGFVVEPVNSAYTIYTTSGAVVAGPFNVNKLYDEGYKQFTSDPRCYYDQSTHTWFAIILFINSTNTIGRTDLAVNTSGDPTTPWTVYHISGTDSGGNGCPCFGDQPLLGIDQFNVYISTNEFSIQGPQFNGAQIYAISKSQLVTLAPKINYVHFGNLHIGGAIAASVQPALTYDTNADAEYFMNSLDPFGTFDDRIGVWAMTDRNAVSKGGTPILSKMVITSEPYAIPPKAKQQGSTSTLDSGDDRMQQVQFINDTLWGALATSVTIPHDTQARAGIAWFSVQPSLNGNTIGSATIQNQGYIAVLGNYVLYPAIQANYNGNVAIVMTFTGKTYYPGAAYAYMKSGSASFGDVHLVATGHGSYYKNSTRWGDYSWAVLDPSGKDFWMATEYIPPKSSWTTDGKQNWGTRVLEVSAE
jgi:hypothetical protein